MNRLKAVGVLVALGSIAIVAVLTLPAARARVLGADSREPRWAGSAERRRLGSNPTG